MGKRLEVPADLDFLIEKREGDGDRRKADRKPASGEAAAQGERRKQGDRRKKRRPKSDS